MNKDLYVRISMYSLLYLWGKFWCGGGPQVPVPMGYQIKWNRSMYILFIYIVNCMNCYDITYYLYVDSTVFYCKCSRVGNWFNVKQCIFYYKIYFWFMDKPCLAKMSWNLVLVFLFKIHLQIHLWYLNTSVYWIQI